MLSYAKNRDMQTMPHKVKYAVRKVPLVGTRVEKQSDC